VRVNRIDFLQVAVGERSRGREKGKYQEREPTGAEKVGVRLRKSRLARPALLISFS
jgi:hypothetical protein